MATVFLEYAVDFWAIGSLPLGLALEVVAGGSRWKPEPCRVIDPLARVAERGLRGGLARRAGGAGAELVAGSLLALVVVGLVGGLAWLAVEVFDAFGGPASLIGRALLIAGGLSFRRVGLEVLRASEAADLGTARRLASSFIGLDSARLDPSGVRRGCVGSLGERANRVAIAPLFWLAAAGPAGLWSYQAIETLRGQVVDAPRHRYLGFTWARLHDLANFLPARLTWLLISLSAALLGEDGPEAFRQGWAQGSRRPDRDDVWGSASLSAALGLQPGGSSSVGPVEPGLVRRALRIVQVAGFHAAVLALAFRIAVWGD